MKTNIRAAQLRPRTATEVIRRREEHMKIHVPRVQAALDRLIDAMVEPIHKIIKDLKLEGKG